MNVNIVIKIVNHLTKDKTRKCSLLFAKFKSENI